MYPLGDPSVDDDIPNKWGWMIPIFETKLESKIELAIFFKEFAQLADKIIQASVNANQYQESLE